MDGAIIADVPSPTMARKVLDQSPAVENLLSSISFYRAKSYAHVEFFTVLTWNFTVLTWNLFAVVLDSGGVNVVLNFARLCFLVGLTCVRLTPKGRERPNRAFLILGRLPKLDSRPDSREILHNSVLPRILANKTIFIKNT